MITGSRSVMSNLKQLFLGERRTHAFLQGLWSVMCTVSRYPSLWPPQYTTIWWKYFLCRARAKHSAFFIIALCVCGFISHHIMQWQNGFMIWLRGQSVEVVTSSITSLVIEFAVPKCGWTAHTQPDKGRDRQHWLCIAGSALQFLQKLGLPERMLQAALARFGEQVIYNQNYSQASCWIWPYWSELGHILRVCLWW